MSVRVRFAPSPTGRLHVGNFRQLTVNWLFALSHGGALVLRIDDTDHARSRPEFVAGIREDVAWFGVVPELEVAQSARADRHAAAADRLRASGRLYPCYETEAELELRRKVRLGQGLPPVYDRAALRLTDADRARLEGGGRRPHWRFRLDDEEVVWTDLAAGEVRIRATDLSDPVLIREDGQFLYTLPSVVDDGELSITHVIRGEDHLTNTAPQIQLFRALGFSPPAFAHVPLLLGADGAKLSKRTGARSAEELRADGIEPLALASLLARLGTADPVEPRTDWRALADGFALGRLSRAAPRFDPAELARVNGKLLALLPWEAVAARLPDVPPAFWLAVRGNCARVAEAALWWAIATGPDPDPVALHPDEAPFLTQAAALLPPEPWDATTWGAWTGALAAATGRKGRTLFQPLRLALTGRLQGPEMAALLPWIGAQRALRRLVGVAADVAEA